MARTDTNGSKAEYLFRSKLPDIQISNHLPLHTYCFERLAEHSERQCLIDGASGNILSYADVDLVSRKAAAGLAKVGLQQGQVLMLLLPNCVEFAFVFLGASIRGAISTTANPFYSPAEIAKQATAANARIIVTQAVHVQKLRDLIDADPDLVVITTDVPAAGCLHISVLTGADENDCPAAEIHPDDVVALPFSSGTTGLPKGVMLTHKGQVSSVAQQVDGDNPNVYLRPEDVVLCVLPLFHILSFNSTLLCALRVGAAVVLMQKFNIFTLLELIQKYRVTVAPFAPPIVLEIAKNPAVAHYDVSSVRAITCGGAPLGKDLEDALRARFPATKFGQGYGMTEAGPGLGRSLGFAKVPFPVKSGSCGTVVRNAQMKIIHTETGASLPHNQPGEICIRGPQIMKGYLNDPEATANTIDNEGWLHTGDVGYIDDDQEIFIVDRVKELIKFKGFQVAPAELEALLVNHLAIADAAVVPEKNEAAGEVPVAFVVKSDGAEIGEQELKDFVAEQVVFYKKIQKVYFVDSIPKSASGKILRKDLRARLAHLN